MAQAHPPAELLALQRLIAGQPSPAGGVEPSAADSVHEAAQLGISGAAGPLPHFDQIQKSFGHHNIGGVVAHTDARAVAGSCAMGATAFTTSNHVAFAAAPSLHTAAHEAAHVVQQRAGIQLEGGVGKQDDEYERHADRVAELVLRGQSSEALLDQHAGRPHSALAATPIHMDRTAAPETAQPADGLEHAADRVAASVLRTGAAVPGAAAGPTAALVQRAPLAEGAPGALSAPGGGPALAAPPSGSMTLDAFELGKAELTAEHKDRLAAEAAELKRLLVAQPDSFVTLVGHTDAVGTEERNKALGQQRADVVLAALQALGVPPQLLRAYSLGETALAVVSQKAEPRNRRVEILVTARNSFRPSISEASPGRQADSSFRPLPPLSSPIPSLRPGELVSPPAAPGPRAGASLPPWFWKQLPATRPSPEALKELSRWLTGTLHRSSLAGLAADLAAKLGVDRQEVYKSLDDAMVSGGEEALKQLLNSIIQALAGSPAGPQSNPYGPAVQERPGPSVLKTPAIPF